MAFFKDIKADAVKKDAQRAIDENRKVFVLQMRAGATFDADLTRPIPGFAETMEAVESLRWVLDKSTFLIHGNKPSAYLIYRHP